jgi:tetratricopeptide (TPR) repeat protein
VETIRLTSSGSAAEQARIPSTQIAEPVHFELEDLFCILQLEPNNSLIAMLLVEKLITKNRAEEALKVARNIVKIDSRFETLNLLGQIEYQMDLIDPAFRHLQQALLIAPDDTPLFFDIYKTLGNIFVRRGDFDSAEDSYNKAHRVKPDSDMLYVNLGTLGIQREAWDEALEKFRQALAINITNDKAWVGLAIGHRMKGDLELAWGNIEAALEYNPLNEMALGLALEWSVNEGREFRVLELIRIYLIEGGWSERLSLAFAWLSWRRGETAPALLELERLLAVSPENLQAHELLRQIRTGN